MITFPNLISTLDQRNPHILAVIIITVVIFFCNLGGFFGHAIGIIQFEDFFSARITDWPNFARSNPAPFEILQVFAFTTVSALFSSYGVGKV